ncbi:hypothetical protein GCM10010922_22400 [Microbacterium sorbitolivorans]|uniref:Acyl-CoA carboxylase subunit epsilon n=1 Tax=Microbacterium sorbitolivorans TaxID=1867410 RepID=A0A367XU64_9MICO|nr:acyl-CoA carboxylase subunit epsilon [Microbacterium sorbitolivorans]RCK57158.1 acyl-CoA carboxylase subunit epsilon [Microbacterium sorbitolivorans]GGF46141.1 hypothetical protein GCM10010922_22400 [Microbacterium sorbitolivorans]
MSDLALRVTRGNPTEEELAAVLAVVGNSYAEEADGAKAPERRVPDRWIRSKRLRTYPRDRWS